MAKIPTADGTRPAEVEFPELQADIDGDDPERAALTKAAVEELTAAPDAYEDDLVAALLGKPFPNDDRPRLDLTPPAEDDDDPWDDVDPCFRNVEDETEDGAAGR